MPILGADKDWWRALVEESSTGQPSEFVANRPAARPESTEEPTAFRGATPGTTSLTCDEAEPEPPAHSTACGCGACALPSIFGLEPQDPRQEVPGDAPPGIGAPGLAGTEAAIIAANVVLNEIPDGGIGIAYGDTFKLHSNPGSRYIVYLDFDGHTTTGTSWNSYWKTTSINSPAFSLDSSASFGANELLAIQRIWQRVAEYFSPFNINVTTEDPGVDALRYSGSTDQAFGVRAVITDEGGKNYGGIGYTGSFDWSSDTPVFVYANRLADSTKNIADATAHEVGHSLGLSHDGIVVNGTRQDYYYGHGTGVTDWAPVMGVGYSANIVQWSKGEYTNATTLQDDLAIITTQNSGVAYRTDDWGNSFTTAGALAGTEAGGVVTVQTFGVISGSGSRNDVDMFRFDVAAGGSLDLTVSSWTRIHVSGSSTPTYAPSPFSMMDVSLSLYDGAKKLIQTVNEATSLGAQLVASALAGGTYYIAIDGVGFGNPLATSPTGYTEYGSLGQYMVTGTYTKTLATPPSDPTPPPSDPTPPPSDPTPPPSDPTPPPSDSTTTTPTLSVSRVAVVTQEGGAAETVVVKAANATGDITVQVSGLDPAEGSLSATSLLLNAANGWTANLGIAGPDDDNANGDGLYTLTLAAAGLQSVTIAVTNEDNDLSATSGGRFFGTYITTPNVNNATISAQRAVDSFFTTLREGVTTTGAGIDFRWQFTDLAAGDKVMQVVANSGVEAFRFEYSADDGATWQRFLDAPDAALSWSGEFIATGVGSTLWVRLVDAVMAGDTVRDTVTINLMTVSDAQVSGIDAIF
ncbi:hypothetical protein DFH01_27275 [Falsiroseomonas bella]|uniref:Uncharacterized protein n=1 Tax=Falsiroseomonas bella TaxID=2184016 RepID=A0A317F5A0_9PROT|nr:zinc-dependent metalloprotease family protein [Falsiroseomonas bella]PWS34035.1 hypothetical protein DFH01_27275 [Falsiroseomonas bella]